MIPEGLDVRLPDPAQVGLLHRPHLGARGQRAVWDLVQMGPDQGGAEPHPRIAPPAQEPGPAQALVRPAHPVLVARGMGGRHRRRPGLDPVRERIEEPGMVGMRPGDHPVLPMAARHLVPQRASVSHDLAGDLGDDRVVVGVEAVAVLVIVDHVGDGGMIRPSLRVHDGVDDGGHAGQIGPAAVGTEEDGARHTVMLGSLR